MKKTKLFFTMMITVLMLMLCSSLNVFALTEGDWEFQLLDNEVEITNYIGEGGEVVIPETIYGASVTKLESDVFNSYHNNRIDSIISVEFPSTIKVIPSGFCEDGKNLKKVIFNEGLEEIGRIAFEDCTNLEIIHLPSTIKIIGDRAFKNTSVSEVNFHKNIEEIGAGAFANTEITEIDLNDLSDECVFTGWDGGGTFSSCMSLKSVKMRRCDKIIPKKMFWGCTALEDVVLSPELETISEGAFHGCISLENIILPVTLKEIDSWAFSGTGLKEVVIPYGTKKISAIYNGIFSGCKNLKSLYIPDTVTEISADIIDNSNNCIIYCSSGSKAEEICKKNKISYLTDNSVNSEITVLYNGTRISFHSYGQNPELLNSRTLVPLRSIFEAMGADVEWDGATSTAVAKRDGVEVKIQIGANEMYKDGKPISVDVPAMLLNDRTMVPVRVIAEAFGADVQWNGNGRTVLITE